MAWSDFDDKSALERDMIERALPVASIASDRSSRLVVDPRQYPALTAFVQGSDSMGGHNPAECVDALGIRPLLVGAAWKVLDLLLEEALDQDGHIAPTRSGSWAIEEKRKKAVSHVSQPAGFDAQDWSLLMDCYVRTVELRHSLTHRKAYTDPATGDLIGVDSRNQPLKPLPPVSRRRSGRRR